MRMILNLLPDEFRQNQNYKRYSRLMTLLGRLANTSDTFIDMGDDFKSRKIGVKPSLRNRGTMLKRMFPDAVDAIRHLNPRVVTEIVPSVVHQLKRKNSNREPQMKMISQDN